MVPITTEDIKQIEPFEVFVKNASTNGLNYPSKISSITFTVDRERLKKHLGILSGKRIGEVRKA